MASAMAARPAAAAPIPIKASLRIVLTYAKEFLPLHTRTTTAEIQAPLPSVQDLATEAARQESQPVKKRDKYSELASYFTTGLGRSILLSIYIFARRLVAGSSSNQSALRRAKP